MEFVAYLWTARATLLRNGLQIASVRSCQQLVRRERCVFPKNLCFDQSRYSEALAFALNAFF